MKKINRVQQKVGIDDNASLQGRTDCVDLLKAYCALLIVIIHAPFPGTIGNYITSLTRIAVPIFFMISGYFYKKDRLILQIKKIAVLFAEANLLFLLWDLLYGQLSGNRLDITFKSIMHFLFLNVSPFSGHLWYLGAILYVLIFMWGIEQTKFKKVIFYVTPVLLLGDLILGKYSLLLLGKEIPFIIVRNFLFVGIPYFAIGILMNEKKFRIGVWGIPVFTITTLVERFILVSLNANAVRDHYISTTFLAIAVFSFVLEYKGAVWQVAAKIGREYSTWVYIIHPIFITCYGFVFKRIGIYNGWCCVAAVVVYITTVIFVAFATEVIRRIRFQRR